MNFKFTSKLSQSATIAALLAVSPLHAISMSDLAQCYSSEYSADHLKSQPKQNLTNMQIFIDAEQSRLTVGGTLRNGDSDSTDFSCFTASDGSNLSRCCTFECIAGIDEIKEIDQHTILVTIRNGAFGGSESGKEEIFWEGDERDNPPHKSPGGISHSYKLYAASNKTCEAIE